MRNTRIRIALVVFLSVLAIFWLPTLHAETHTVTQINLTFSPSSLTIAAGDTVRWVRTAGSHTVTNGTGAADPNAGTLFDAPLNLTTPSFEYVFTVPATYPYFCRPHESFGMTGTITVDPPTGVRPSIPHPAVLHQNHPNPFGSGTAIEYTLSEATRVKLRIFDVRGRMVATVDDGFKPDGPHSVSWDGRASNGRLVSTGVYYYQLEVGDVVLTKKLMIMR